MNPKEVLEIQKEVKETEEYINFYLEKYPLYPRILIIGLTGSGKSCVAGCLSNKKIIIAKEGSNFIQLKGEGIFGGCKAGTEKPEIYVDEKNELLYVDCPGFEDVDGMYNEIRNAFDDDNVLKKTENTLRIKILLVVSAPEFQTRRGRTVYDTILRMKRMFPNPESFRNKIGIIITKGDIDVPGKDYFSILEKRACPELKNWCDYFIAFHKEQVFTFPLASKENIGKQYTFNDYDRLMEFLQYDYIIDPKHEVALSSEALNELKAIKEEHLRSMMELLEELFLSINEQYRKINNSATLNVWLTNMHYLLDQDINNIAEFRTAIQKIIPNVNDFNQIFEQLKEYEIFDSFVDRICEIKTMMSYLKSSIINLSHAAIKELEKLSSVTTTRELQEKMLQEKNEMIRKYEENIRVQQRKIDELVESHRISQSTILKLRNEINQQRQESDKRIEELQNNLFEIQNIRSLEEEKNKQALAQLQNKINSLQNDLEREKNKPAPRRGRRCLLI